MDPIIDETKDKPLPGDYIWRRGNEEDVDNDIELNYEPPPGFYKLHLYSTKKMRGYTNMNPRRISEDDIVHPIETYPWPFADNSVMSIVIGPEICQLFNLGDFIHECYRVLVHDGYFVCQAPYYKHTNYYANGRNINPITEDTFGYYSIPWMEANGVAGSINCDFEPVNVTFFYNDEWELRAENAKEFARRHYWNVVEVIRVTLSAFKPMRRVNEHGKII